MRRFYEGACSLLERLCPNPRPQPLLESGFSLKAVAGVDPLIVSALASADVKRASEVVRSLADILSTGRGARCTYCGSKTSQAVEKWVFLLDERGDGVAKLEDIVPVCRDCARALEPVGALSGEKKEFKWLVKYLSKVNRVKKQYAEQAIALIAEEWRRSKFVSRWSIDVSTLSRFNIDYTVVSGILELAANGRIRFKGGMLVVPNPSPLASILVVATEVLESLCSGTLNSAMIASKAATNNLKVNRVVLEEYISSLIETGACRKGMKGVSRLEGAWVIALPAEVRAKLVARLAGEPGIESTFILRAETPAGHVNPAPIYFYSAPSLEPEYIARSAQDVAELLSSLTRTPRLELRFYPQGPEGRLEKRHLYSYQVE